MGFNVRNSDMQQFSNNLPMQNSYDPMGGNTMVNGDLVIINHRHYGQPNPFPQYPQELLALQLGQIGTAVNKTMLALLAERKALEEEKLMLSCEMDKIRGAISVERAKLDYKEKESSKKDVLDVEYEIIDFDSKIKEEKENININENNDGGQCMLTENFPYEKYFLNEDVRLGILNSIESQRTEEGVAMRDRKPAFMPDTLKRGECDILIAHVYDDYYWRQRVIFAGLHEKVKPCLILFYNKKCEIVNNLLVVPSKSKEKENKQYYAPELTATSRLLKLISQCKTLNMFYEPIYDVRESSPVNVLDQFDTLAFPSIFQDDYRVMIRMTINEYKRRMVSFDLN